MTMSGRSGEASIRMNSDFRDLCAALNAAGARIRPLLGGWRHARFAQKYMMPPVDPPKRGLTTLLKTDPKR